VSSLFGGAKSRKAFAYDSPSDDLPNGLRLGHGTTDYPNTWSRRTSSYQTGSRNEPEKGKSGYAHLFEHLMFRGSEHYTASNATEILKKAGANDNVLYHRRPHRLSTKSFPKTTWTKSSNSRRIGFSA